MQQKKNKLLVAISGGIDSSMTIFLIKKNFFYTESVFMKNWNSSSLDSCLFKIDLIYVKNICKKLNLKLHILDYTKSYWNFVFINFLKDLKIGITPNPDVLCNKQIKFKIFFYYTIHVLKFDFLLTGHYSGIVRNLNKIEMHDNFDIKKNQSYFLHSIKKNIRKKIVFPLINYLKVRLRILVKKILLINFNKKSSTGICFIGEKNFNFFIKKYLKLNSGLIFNEKSDIIGKHEGLFFYTIGQKKYINLKVHKTLYVYDKTYKKNYLHVTNDEKKLFSRIVIINKLTIKLNNKTNIFQVKMRHTEFYSTALILWYHKYKKYGLFFKELQKSITPGQPIVFYKNKTCLGGAVIYKKL